MLGFVLAVIQWCLTVWIALKAVWQRSTAVVCRTLFPSSTGTITKRLSAVQRRPKHLSLVFVEEDLSFSDIARLVAWSTLAGIAYVTVCDHRGIDEQLNMFVCLALLRKGQSSFRFQCHCDVGRTDPGKVWLHWQDFDNSGLTNYRVGAVICASGPSDTVTWKSTVSGWGIELQKMYQINFFAQ